MAPASSLLFLSFFSEARISISASRMSAEVKSFSNCISCCICCIEADDIARSIPCAPTAPTPPPAPATPAAPAAPAAPAPAVPAVPAAPLAPRAPASPTLENPTAGAEILAAPAIAPPTAPPTAPTPPMPISSPFGIDPCCRDLDRERLGKWHAEPASKFENGLNYRISRQLCFGRVAFMHQRCGAGRGMMQNHRVATLLSLTRRAAGVSRLVDASVTVCCADREACSHRLTIIHEVQSTLRARGLRPRLPREIKVGESDIRRRLAARRPQFTTSPIACVLNSTHAHDATTPGLRRRHAPLRFFSLDHRRDRAELRSGSGAALAGTAGHRRFLGHLVRAVPRAGPGSRAPGHRKSRPVSAGQS